MRRGSGLAAIAALIGVSALALAFSGRMHRAYGVKNANGVRTPVIVELFTSEGCSSCPSADAALIRLKRSQPVAGAEVIALGEHVDYWNGNGWADPYSSAAFSARQSDYAQALGLSEVYTPQAIVDGRTEFVGSDQDKAEDAIAHAAQTPKAHVQIERDDAAGVAHLRVKIDHLPAVRSGDTVDVMLAITEDNLRSHVARGENAGRTLAHAAVVRRLSRIGSVRPGDAFTASPQIDIDSRWKRDDLSAVIFVQERASRRILGAALLPLS